MFLDRDGVLNRPVVRGGLPYPPATLEEFELYQDVPAGCAALSAGGFILLVATNQPDVGRGTQDRSVVEAMHRKLRHQVPEIAGIEVCYHAGARQGEPCTCRKPQPGMIQSAAAAHGIDLARSYLIGDRWRDIDCARAAGCRAIFIDRHYGETLRAAPDQIVTSFAEAVNAVLCETQSGLHSEECI